MSKRSKVIFRFFEQRRKPNRPVITSALISLSLALLSFISPAVSITAPHTAVAQTNTCTAYGDIRVVLSWNTNRTDIDTHVYDPNGNHAWYGGLSGIPGGRLDYDDVDGYGPETFTQAEPITGTYRVRIHYFADHNSGGSNQNNTNTHIDANAKAQAKAEAAKQGEQALLPASGDQANATPTVATVHVFVGGVSIFSGSRTLSTVKEWWDTFEFTLCGGQPIIVSVTPKYDLDNTRFLEGISVQNEIKVKVNWLGHEAGWVDFTLNGRIIASPIANGTDAVHTINVGQDLKPGRNVLELKAYAGQNSDNASESKTFQFYSIPQPLWIAGLINNGLGGLPSMASGSVSGEASYTLGFHLPNDPFKFHAPTFGPPDGKVGFDWEIEGQFVIPITCATPLSAQLSGKGELSLLNAKVGLTGYGGLESQRTTYCGLSTPNGFAGAKLNFTGNLYRKPLLVMITYFNFAVGRTVDTIVAFLHIEDIIGTVGEFYLDGTLGVDARTNIEFYESSGSFMSFKDLTVEGSIGAQGGFRSNLGVVEVDVYAGASGALKYKRPGAFSLPITESWLFDSVTLKGEVGAKFRALWYTREAKGEIKWTYPPSAQQWAQMIDELHHRDWQLIRHAQTALPRIYQLAPSANQAFAGEVSLSDGVQIAEGRAATSAIAAAQTITSLFVSNIYTYPETSLSLNPSNNHIMQIWVVPDTSKPVGQAHELVSSVWSGASWSMPQHFTNDDRLDASPQSIWLSNNQNLAVWHRLNTVTSPDVSLTVTTAKQIEIAYATYDPGTTSWSPVALLTSNDALDSTPRLARNSSGAVLAAWRRNAAGLLSGDTTNTDQLMTAFYETSWSTPAVAVDAIQGLIEYAVAHGDNAGVLAFTRKVAPTGSVTPTAQIFVSQWNGTAWSAAAQLTDLPQAQHSPQVFYNTVNQPVLVWVSGQVLKVRNLVTLIEHIQPIPSSIKGIDELDARMDSTGNIIATFVDAGNPRDFYVAFYDAPFGLWGNPRRLTQDVHSERYPAPALDSTNKLLASFARTAIRQVEQTQVSGGETTTFTVLVEGQTDLLTLSHTFERNLTVSNADFSASQYNPTPGSTIVLSANVRNTGDRTISGTVLSFYRSDPSFGGFLIQSIALTEPLVGQSERLITITATVNSSDSVLYALADSANAAAESNELDNKAQLVLVGPDLEIVSTLVRYWNGANADLMTVVKNNGRQSSSTWLLAYARDVISASNILSLPVASLAPGARVTLTNYLDLLIFQPGRYPLVAQVRSLGISDLVTTNNRLPFTIQVLPDLLLAQQDAQVSPLNASTVTVSATVVNVGAAQAGPSIVSFYRSPDYDTTSLILTRTLDAITPTGSTNFETDLSGPLCHIHVVVNADGELDERSSTNNIASKTQSEVACADFGYKALSGSPTQLPYTVQFQDMSSGGNTTWSWNFGDGGIANTQNPTHTYSNKGVYTVTLTISSTQGTATRTYSELLRVPGPPNRLPAAANDSFTVSANTRNNLLSVLTNDSDEDGDRLTVVSVAPPQRGTTITDTLGIRYTPASGFVGTDTFTYIIEDGKGGTASAQVTVAVQSRLFLPIVRKP